MIFKAGKQHQQAFHCYVCEVQEAAKLQEQMKNVMSEIKQ